MKFTLRPYQKESTDLLRTAIIESRKDGRGCRPILCLPTGAGKTVTFSFLAEQAQKKNRRVSVVCHRTELIEQAKTTMKAYGINPLMIDYGMVQTYTRSPHKIPKMDLCIIDECHIGNFRKFIDLLPETVQIVGATATPISASNKNPLRNAFTDVVCPIQINELIEQKFLSKPEYHVWEIDESKLELIAGEFSEQSQSKVFSIDNIIEAYKRRIGKTIIFCSSIKQTIKVGDTLQQSNPNDTILVVHSKMKSAEREQIVKQYKTTPNATIINCGILTAGFDEPIIETVIMFRATTSLPLWLQICGRGSRILKGLKEKFYIFDLGNNLKRLGAWEINRNWDEVFKLQGRKVKDKEAPMKKCCKCEAVIFASSKVCPYCQAVQPIKEKQELIADKITVINSYSELPEHLRIKYDQMSVKQLIERAQYGSPNVGRPFKNGWIIQQLKDRNNYPNLLEEFARIKGYKQGWVLRQLQYTA